MLRPDGVVVDDGTTSRVSENHYFMTTTTGGAGKVMTYMEQLLQTAWSDLKVQLTSVSGQWAGVAVAGPKSRELLDSLIDDQDFSNEAFPFMGVRHAHIGEIPVRLLRISFSGEMAYEVYCGANYGELMWEAIAAKGLSYGLMPYGTEALGALRVEKGHVAGPEIDGRTTLDDMGMGRMASKKKEFIGSALRRRDGLTELDRPQLVGLEVAGQDVPLKAGAILCEPGQLSGHGIGWVSSVTYSPALGKHIGLGFVSGGMERKGEQIDAHFPLHNETQKVRIISPHMFDPDGGRLNA
jgi:sarcosine oxidase subunit alpha